MFKANCYCYDRDSLISTIVHCRLFEMDVSLRHAAYGGLLRQWHLIGLLSAVIKPRAGTHAPKSLSHFANGFQ